MKQVRLCSVLTKAGEPCGAPAQNQRGKSVCYNHDAERLEERRRNARRNASSPDGARRRLKRVERELPRVRSLYLEFIEKIMAGELTPHQAKQANALIGASHALNRATNIELEYRRHVEFAGVPPEQAGGVIEDLAEEAERLMGEVIEGEVVS